MILLDANLLLYAHHPLYRQHDRARTWLNEQLASGTRVGLSWPSILAFLRISTNPRAFREAQPISVMWQVVRAWLANDDVWIPEPTDRHAEMLGDTLLKGNLTAKLVPDAHLAVLAMEHGLVLCSSDGDFARFPKLRWFNPLE